MPIEQAIGPTVLAYYPTRKSALPVDEVRRANIARSMSGSHRTAGSIATPARSDLASVDLADAGRETAKVENPSARIENTSCTYRGSTFAGEFCVSGTGPDAIVSVHRHDAELESKVGTSTVDAIAAELLSRIVMQEAVSKTVEAGEKGQRFSDDQRKSAC